MTRAQLEGGGVVKFERSTLSDLQYDIMIAILGGGTPYEVRDKAPHVTRSLRLMRARGLVAVVDGEWVLTESGENETRKRPPRRHV